MALTDNLVSYWTLDESSGNASDSVGSNTGTNSNVTYTTGKINNGAVFNGTNAILTLGTTSTLKTSAFSMSTWINGDSFASNPRIIFCNQIHGNYYGWNLGIGTDGKPNLSLQSSGATKNITSATVLSTGTWYHLVVTYDGTTGIIYLNGSENKNEASGLTLAYEAGANTVIGNRDGSTTNWFDGMIDEVGIWSRALTATEVSQLWNGGRGSQYQFTDVGIYYDNSTASGSIASNVEWDHTVGTGSNRLLVVGCYTPGTGGDAVSAITYNGDAMTRVNATGSAGGPYTYLYYLVNPDSGTNKVKITHSGTNNVRAVATSYANVNQTSQPNVANTATSASNTSLDCSMTTTTDNCWIMGIAEVGNTPIAGTNTLMRAISSYVGAFDTNTVQTPAGSKTVQITQSGAAEMNICAAAFAPVAANYTITCETGAYSLTGVTTPIGVGLVAQVGQFIMTGIDIALNFVGWTNVTKNSTTWTDVIKNSTTWTDTTKSTSTWTNLDKS